MDPDPFRHLEFFSMPNSQTVNPVDQAFLSASSAPASSIWDTSGLNADGGLAVSPMSPNLSSASRPSAHGGQHRPVLPARAPRKREGHERKRSRLSTDSTPLDSVDYWIDFDKDDSLGSIPEGMEAPRPDVEGKDKSPTARRRTNPAPQPPPLTKEEVVDDSALDNALSDDDEGFSSLNLADHLSKIDSAPPQEVPPREGLYSTPLSWERPQPGGRLDSLTGLHSPALDEAEQRRLIAIAMNPGPSMGGLGASISSNFGGLSPGVNPVFGAGLGSSCSTTQGPKPVSPPQAPTAHPRPAGPNPPKRQGSMSEKGKEKPKTGDRTAHNDIERKYRTNLKDKISELRDAIPSLRTISENGGEEDGTQPSRAPKASKGTVLTKATEYIHWLERRNKQIAQEHRELSRRLQAFEQLLNATARSQYTMPTYSTTLFDPRGFC
ncbi:hypothetical protein N656DRAFT_711785 [Canariomyces notabilis]|uniref:BHLH domain-containing protein n=1 Tax=Canariomyces notabilis TaxID=2074819 RepID=A0AAN6TBE6_9PEZI|nr:hypothetical protein N656DRAFT_711785 [Canariomyces arenarius]